MLTPIEQTGISPASTSLVHAVQTAQPDRPAYAALRSGEPTAALPASLTQKATVTRVTIDPATEPPRKLLKPFGIEMWAGAPRPVPDPDDGKADPSDVTVSTAAATDAEPDAEPSQRTADHESAIDRDDPTRAALQQRPVESD